LAALDELPGGGEQPGHEAPAEPARLGAGPGRQPLDPSLAVLAQQLLAPVPQTSVTVLVHVQPCQLDLEADELCSLRVPGVLQPAGVHKARPVLPGRLPDRLEQGVALVHAHLITWPRPSGEGPPPRPPPPPW